MMRRYKTLLGVIMASRVLQIAGDGGEGGGGGDVNPAAAFQRLLERNNNDGIKLASTLFDENFQYRQTIRTLKEAQPKDGSVILSPEDAKKWKAYNDLGQEPKDIKKALDEFPTLQKTNKELSAMEHIRDLADIGLDGQKLKVSVLKDQILTKFPDAEFRFATEKDKDGKEVRNAYIKPTTDGQETTFSDFAAQNLSDYLPALKVTAEQTPAPIGMTPDPKPAGGANSVFDQIRNEVKSKQEEAVKANSVSIASRFGRAEA
jgi:hypothetical protein